MASTVEKLTELGLIRPESWLPNNTMYETIMGSVAYGVSSDTSDMDVYGWCIPPKEVVFPHLSGEIIGFGKWATMPEDRFEQFEASHIVSPSELGGKGRTYDLQIYGIVKFFEMARKANPHIIDSLFTPQECVLHTTQVGCMVRDGRRLFLHKGIWHTYKDYAISQLHKMTSKKPTGKRKELREQFGFDVKFAYNVVRLLDECEQILTNGEIDLRRNREQLKAIRRGEISEDEIRKWASDKELQLERLYNSDKCEVQENPSMGKIKKLLMACLEHHYGNLSNAVVEPELAEHTLAEIKEVLVRYERLRS